MICWGIDAASDRLSVAAIESEGLELRDVCTIGPIHAATPELRLYHLLQAAKRGLSALADDYPAAFVAIEQPMGQHRNPRLDAGWGVITAAVVGVTQRHGGAVRWENISTWRDVSGIRRHFTAPPRGAPKGSTRRAWKTAALALAGQHGYDGRCEDEADAVCIALAACATVSPDG